MIYIQIRTHRINLSNIVSYYKHFDHSKSHDIKFILQSGETTTICFESEHERNTIIQKIDDIVKPFMHHLKDE